jgi:hypothetical protein
VPLTIVASTGRCGSTMLSRILQMHPDVLSISEFWNTFLDHGASVLAYDIPTRDITGEEYWHRISVCDPYFDGLNAAGLNEYPPGGRFDPATGVPRICRVLELLAGDSGAIYDKLATSVPSWPLRQMADHCRALFDELAIMLGRRVIVERTGGVLRLVPVLREQFPEARWVFLHRDGPDTALSMSHYPAYRLFVMKMILEVISSPSAADIPMPPEIRTAKPEDLKELIEPPFDVDRFLSYPIPLSLFGWLWSSLTRTGASGLLDVPHDRLMTLRYECLLKDSHAELARLASFLGVPAEKHWLDEAKKFTDPGRVGGAVTKLHPGALAELRASCVSGKRAYELLESQQAAATNASP